MMIQERVGQIAGLIALVILVLFPTLFLFGKAELDSVKSWMLIMTVVWFVAATVWMWKSDDEQSASSEKSE